MPMLFRSVRHARAILFAAIAASLLLPDPAFAQRRGMMGGFGGGDGFGGRGGFGTKGEPGGTGQGGGMGRNVRDPVDFYFPDYDANQDGHLDKAEWKRRGNFERLDADKNGTIEPSEFRALYEDWGRKGAMANPIRPADTPTKDASLEKDRVAYKEADRRHVCGIVRTGVPGAFKCANGNEIATELGLFETGIGPVFPNGAFCHGIDEIFAMEYTAKTGKGMHGGIDLPTDFGTPILAVASGTIVAKFDPEINARGKTVVLRHSPADTGLPFWVFTEYAHLDAMPEQEVGQRVRMGEVLGPTGNSGISKKNRSGISRRRPGVHFAVYYSDSPRFIEVPNYIVPQNARWMDSTALYRKAPPYDSQSLKALPDAEKDIPVPVMYLDGTTEPAGTKLIWPYACKRD